MARRCLCSAAPTVVVLHDAALPPAPAALKQVASLSRPTASVFHWCLAMPPELIFLASSQFACQALGLASNNLARVRPQQKSRCEHWNPHSTQTTSCGARGLSPDERCQSLDPSHGVLHRRLPLVIPAALHPTEQELPRSTQRAAAAQPAGRWRDLWGLHTAEGVECHGDPGQPKLAQNPQPHPPT